MILWRPELDDMWLLRLGWSELVNRPDEGEMWSELRVSAGALQQI